MVMSLHCRSRAFEALTNSMPLKSAAYTVLVGFVKTHKTDVCFCDHPAFTAHGRPLFNAFSSPDDALFGV